MSVAGLALALLTWSGMQPRNAQAELGENHPVQIITRGFGLRGDLNIPPNAQGVVLFAHGSGSSRLSPRNRAVARALQDAQLATLLLDLLTEQEEEADEVTREFRFDIDLLTARLVVAAEWLKAHEHAGHLALGLFGASTGAAAALKAAARLPGTVRAVVSRGGRPDLAGDEDLARVLAPTLFIVGEHDPEVLKLNAQAFGLIRAEKRLEVVPRATHLFEEPGALEEVSRLARGWFLQYLGAEEPIEASH